MKSWRTLSASAFAMLFVPTLVFAQQAPQQATVVEEKDFSLVIGHRTWFSKGNFDYNIGGPDGVPKKISELTWDDVDSTVFEFTADALFYKKFILTVDGGFGAISDGTLRDEDFFPIFTEDILISESISTADDDDMWFVSADLGYRIGTYPTGVGKRTGSIDLLIGYQHWRETYIATKGVQTQDPFGFVGFLGPFPDQGKGITEEVTWDSLRVGFRTKAEILPKLSAKLRTMFIPWTHYELEDIHHFRTDLRQDPSFKDTADGGFGVQLDFALSYNVWRGLSLEAGYQYWDISSGEGTTTTRALTGNFRGRLNEANITRHGAIVGILYRF